MVSLISHQNWNLIKPWNNKSNNVSKNSVIFLAVLRNCFVAEFWQNFNCHLMTYLIGISSAVCVKRTWCVASLTITSRKYMFYSVDIAGVNRRFCRIKCIIHWNDRYVCDLGYYALYQSAALFMQNGSYWCCSCRCCQWWHLREDDVRSHITRRWCRTSEHCRTLRPSFASTIRSIEQSVASVTLDTQPMKPDAYLCSVPSTMLSIPPAAQTTH